MAAQAVQNCSATDARRIGHGGSEKFHTRGASALSGFRTLRKLGRLAIGLAVLLPVAAQAAQFAVNSTADAVDAAPGDGTCATSTGVCTLRAAIQEANALTGGPHTIRLPPGTYALTISG